MHPPRSQNQCQQLPIEYTSVDSLDTNCWVQLELVLKAWIIMVGKALVSVDSLDTNGRYSFS